MDIVHFQESTEEKAKIEDEVRLPLSISSRFRLLNTACSLNHVAPDSFRREVLVRML